MSMRGFGQYPGVPANQLSSVPPGWIDIPGCFLGTPEDYQIYLANGGCQQNPPASPPPVTGTAAPAPPSVAQSPTVQPIAGSIPGTSMSRSTLPVVVPPGVQERAQWYVGKVENPNLVAGYAQNDLQIRTDSDAPFRLTSIAVYVISATGVAEAAAGNIGVTLRFYHPDGTTGVQQHLLSAQALNPYDASAVNGAGGFTAPYLSLPTPVQPNILFPAGAVITFDFAALAGVTPSLALVVFCGTKLGTPGQFWNGGYPQNFRTRPFFGYALQMSTLNLPLLDQPLNINRDADFVLQTAVQTSYPASTSSPVGALRGLGMRMKDWRGKYYMNDYVPLELIVGGFDYSQTPGVIYPEIYVPKNQALYFDLEVLS